MELEGIHLTVLAITVLVVLYADHLGLDYVRGKRAHLEYTTVRRLHLVVWVGLLGMMLSGFFMMLPQREELLGEFAFYLKMGFVAVLAFNAWVIGRVSHVASERSFAALSSDEKRLFMTSGAISFFSWSGAALIGFFFL